MIAGFENITYDISQHELDVLVPLLIRGLNTKIGKEKAVTNGEIQKGLAKRGLKVRPERIGIMIGYISTKGLVEKLVANSKGYYIEPSMSEAMKYIDSLETRGYTNLKRARILKEQYM